MRDWEWAGLVSSTGERADQQITTQVTLFVDQAKGGGWGYREGKKTNRQLLKNKFNTELTKLGGREIMV